MWSILPPVWGPPSKHLPQGPLQSLRGVSPFIQTLGFSRAEAHSCSLLLREENDGMSWRVLGVQFFLPEGTRMGKDSHLPVSSLLSLTDIAQIFSPQNRSFTFIFTCLLCL